MSEETLFRTDAVKASQTVPLGNILLIRPVTLSVLCAFAAVFAAALAGCFVFGTYTDHTDFSGYLQYREGVVKVYALQAGTVVQSRVADGQNVSQGQVLFVVDAAPDGAAVQPPRRYEATAPRAGIVTRMSAAGEPVERGKSLAIIVPHGGILEAKIFAPVSKVGSIKSGDLLELRYPALPLQVSGTSTAQVLAVSPLPVEDAGQRAFAANGKPGEPLYMVTLSLSEQSIVTTDGQLGLRSGMLLQARKNNRVRPLYEWILRPAA